MNDRDREVILKMMKYCNDIELLMKKYNSDFEAYKTDISFQYSCNMCIIQIGELVSRLSEKFMETHSQIPWYAMKGMRNLHAHDYERIDLGIVWNTLNEDIPDLSSKLTKILNGM
jgi:uncharacterized protein with HEPN domain